MAATNGTIKATQTPAVVTPDTKSWTAIYADLFKARLTILVLLTTLVGFYAATQGHVDYLLMTHTILGTAFVAAGAAALNQLLEREHDARMRRTRGRPLPSGRLRPVTVFWIGVGAGVAGLLYLVLFVSLLVATLGAASLLLYVLVYTPLKRVSWWNTIVGSVPGGLPPLMGWAAGRGEINIDALPLFLVLAFWQVPHFLAIAWMYRDEYAKAGFRMLPEVDPTGARTGRQSVLSAAALLVASICPFFFGYAGGIYLAGTVALGTGFFWTALRFRNALTAQAARQLFFASIVYLPLALGLMVLDKS